MALIAIAKGIILFNFLVFVTTPLSSFYLLFITLASCLFMKTILAHFLNYFYLNPLIC